MIVVHIFKHEYSATSGPITMKAYQKHQRDRGKAALDFGPDQIKYSGFDGNRLLPYGYNGENGVNPF